MGAFPREVDLARHRLLRVGEHACADEAAQASGVARSALMEAAGGAVADAVTRRYAARPTVVLTGPGDNGGDGYVAAQALRAMGWPVRVVALAPAKTACAKHAAARWEGRTDRLADGPDLEARLVIDAVVGAGLSRPFDEPWASALREAGGPDAAVVAVDIPSGVDGDTGANAGPARAADLTVTFLAAKPGHVLEPGRSLCGERVVADIGHPVASHENLGGSLMRNHPARWAGRLPTPTASSHKHARGRLVVASGGSGRTGAARLAAHAGLRAGAGLVTLLTPPEALGEAGAQCTAVMTAPVSDVEAFAVALAQADAAVLGPAHGVDHRTHAFMEAALASPARCVLDADALTVAAREPETTFAALQAQGAGRHVLTPHLGEFRRLFPKLAAMDAGSAAQLGARASGAVVLFKGATTAIAHPDGRVTLNDHAAPWLATAGSGDVLAGIIAGLMAQGMDAFDAACAGAWLHGHAGRLGGRGLTADDLPGLIARAWAGAARATGFDMARR